ncbi:hypothetical protein F9L16_21115 [Agarivorans sp. B2Z047]|uniref:hypothetical protein n=1 Tax=Agarivorans sp. B2Z047 TaxID=2652721 RepID=UPI00128CAE01|nr:hypothetical protein [Agarivorans sp. B2Z047]MPW31479.1 hypothetical protein [Agarivorans sp. B2Z047]UQN42521.1 hypothetical protein LQZ07_22540 [Agarivorans sp. B2Z047]
MCTQTTFTSQEETLINAWLTVDEEAAANCAAKRLSDLRVYQLPGLYLVSLPEDIGCESLTLALLTVSDISVKTLKHKVRQECPHCE